MVFEGTFNKAVLSTFSLHGAQGYILRTRILTLSRPVINYKLNANAPICIIEMDTKMCRSSDQLHTLLVASGKRVVF